MLKPSGLLCSLVLCASLAACATRAYDRTRTQRPFSGAVEEPLRDLSLLRDAPPPILTAAAEAPFSLAPDATCEAVLQDIAALDAILGPDVDTTQDPEGGAINGTELLTGAIGGVWSLPYRSIIRRVTGARQRESALRRAILAGMVRRGFLKGVAARAECNQTTDPIDAID